MRIQNAKVFQNGSFQEGGLEWEGGRITAVGKTGGPADLDAGGAYLIPGLVDIHTHGALGEDASDGKADALPTMSRYYAARGVTSWCPTTMTLPEDVLAQAMGTIAGFVRPSDGAKVAGINMEGPFLCYGKRGAQAGDHLHAPDFAMFQRLFEASGRSIRLVTVAPEEPGALAFIEKASALCTVSLGHTEADYETARAAFSAGASLATHLFNGMPSLLHRAPGVIGAAFDAGASVELICDGYHIHPSVVRVTRQLFGERLVFVSDSLRCAGMPDGDYTLGGQPITMKDGKATLKGSATIAGSSIHLMDSIQRAVSFGIPLEAAVWAATAAPARAIGLDGSIGSLAVGKAADFVLLDSSLAVKAVYIDGRPIH